MKLIVAALALVASACALHSAESSPIENQVAEAVKSPKTTVVHFWAPWCPNCYGELKNKGWSNLVDANRDVNFIFISTWSGDLGDGRAMLEKLGLGTQKNFQVLLNPNTSRRDDEKTTSFLGLPLNWLPATWVFRDGRLRYALNYGEVRFPILQQLIKDSSHNWDG